MSVISTEKLWEEMRREKAEAEQQFLSFAPFTMDPQKGLFITVERRRGKEEREEQIWLSAPFEIIGRVRDPHSHGWARLLQWQDDDRVVHQRPVADEDLHGDGSALCAALANHGLKIVTGSLRQHFVTYLKALSSRPASPLSLARAGMRWAASGPLSFPTALTRRL